MKPEEAQAKAFGEYIGALYARGILHDRLSPAEMTLHATRTFAGDVAKALAPFVKRSTRIVGGAFLETLGRLVRGE